MTWGIWWIIMEAVASLKMCTLMYYFSRKYIMFEPKKYRGVMFHNTEEWCNIWGGTDLCFEKWHEEFGEFWRETRKSQNLHFNGLLLTKLYNVWAKKLQRSHVSWHSRVMQYLKKNWLVVLKMTQGVCLIFMRPVASLKICTLMASLCPKHTKFQMKKYRRVMSHDTLEWSKQRLILDKYPFFVWFNRLKAVSGRYS